MIDNQIATCMSYQPMEICTCTILATLKKLDEVLSNDDVNDSNEGSSKAIKAVNKQ